MIFQFCFFYSVKKFPTKTVTVQNFIFKYSTEKSFQPSKSFQASSGLSDAKVAMKSPIAPLRVFSFTFFMIFALFHDIFINFFLSTPIFPCLGGVSVPFIHRPRRRRKTRILPKNWPKNFGHRGFLEKHFEIWLLAHCVYKL